MYLKALTVNQELQEYDQARRNYQLAVEILIEFGDRYSQASIYGQLGRLAEALEDYTEALTNAHKALDIFIEFKDENPAAIARWA